MQYPNPTVKGRRQYFEIVIEAAIDKPLFRQAQFTACELPFRYFSLRVVDLVAGQIGDFFGVVFLGLVRNEDVIRQQIVVVLGAHGPQVADIAHLDGRRAVGEYADAAVLRMPA